MPLLSPHSFRRRGRLASVSLALIVALATIVAAGAVEQNLPSADIVPDAPASVPVPRNDPAVQAHLPGCAVWTDRCVNCQRDAGKITCSNIGIACQPQAVECLRPEPAEQK
jgi:hypothetical protein